MPASPQANRPQAEFLGLPHKYRGFIGGFGTGKTWVLGMAQCIHFLEHPKVPSGYFGPTYPHIRDIYFPTIEEVAHTFGLRVDIKEANKEAHFYLGRQYRGTSICRSMEHPGRIIGFKIGHATIDEIDTLPKDKATHAWRKIIARLRWNDAAVKNGVDVGTTPEGFLFAYEHFEKQPADNPKKYKDYGLVQASTYENEANLPADYIQSLLDSYPEELIAAYLHGKFVNLKSGTVYYAYDRKTNRSSEARKPGDDLRVGIDFNVGKMAAVVYVIRGKEWHAVDELKEIRDTPAMIEAIKRRFEGKHRIIAYPDASGKSTKSVDASKSDISLLEQAGFTVLYKSTNPFVKDRVNAANKAFSTCKVMVNDTLCPTFAGTLEQQAYDANGEPDKKSGHDHQNDAGTYPIAYEMPIIRPIIAPRVSFPM